jgi:hypothetical protein
MSALGLFLSLLIGVSLGLLGGGGSILTTPILLYALHVDPKPAIATSLVVVGVTSLAGVLQHARAGNVAWRTGLVFGLAGMVGSYVGGYFSHWVPETVLLGLFALMMAGTSIAMFRGREDRGPQRAHPLWQIVLEGTAAGAVTGLVGAGGGFVVVPALALLGGLPMKQAVGTALLVIAMNSFAGFLGHASHVTIDWVLAAQVSAAAVAGSFLGTAMAAWVRPDQLRRGFAVFVLAMACFVLYEQL